MRKDVIIVIYGLVALLLWCYATTLFLFGPTAGFRRVEQGFNPMDVVLPQPELKTPYKQNKGACWGYGERN